MMKPRKRNREWINYLSSEEVELNQVTGFISAGNTAIWARLDGGEVPNEYEFCVHEGTCEKMCSADDLVMQTRKTDRSSCSCPWSSCQIFPFGLFLLFLLSHLQNCQKEVHLLKELWVIQKPPMVMVIALTYYFLDTLVCICPDRFSHDW